MSSVKKNIVTVESGNTGNGTPTGEPLVVGRTLDSRCTPIDVDLVDINTLPYGTILFNPNNYKAGTYMAIMLVCPLTCAVYIAVHPLYAAFFVHAACLFVAIFCVLFDMLRIRKRLAFEAKIPITNYVRHTVYCQFSPSQLAEVWPPDVLQRRFTMLANSMRMTIFFYVGIFLVVLVVGIVVAVDGIGSETTMTMTMTSMQKG